MSLNDGEFQHERIDMDSITFSGEHMNVNLLQFLAYVFVWELYQVEDYEEARQGW